MHLCSQSGGQLRVFEGFASSAFCVKVVEPLTRKHRCVCSNKDSEDSFLCAGTRNYLHLEWRFVALTTSAAVGQKLWISMAL